MEGVSIIIPALNEEKSIGSVIEAVDSCMSKIDRVFEIIVIDDGSIDDTGKIAKMKKAQVIRHPIPAGYGASIRDGIVQAKYDFIVITDADATYPIVKIPELLNYLGDFDMVVGARTGRNYKGSILKHPLRKIFQLLGTFVTGVNIPDINSGLRAFKKRAVMKFSDNFCLGFSFTTTITLAFHLNGYFVKYVPIEYHKRVGKSNIRMLRDTLRATQIITQAILYYNPIKLFLILMIMAFFGSFIFFIAYFVKKSLALLLFSVAFFIVSFLFFGMGLLADAIMKNKKVNGENARDLF